MNLTNASSQPNGFQVNGLNSSQANKDFEATILGMIPAYSIIFLFALTGNVLIIYIVMTKPYMKSTTNFLIANMSVADLLMTFFAMPYSIAYLYIQSRWFGGIIGHLVCKIVQFAVGLSIAASIITLMVISLDRFFAIVYPFRRASVIKRISITNTAIWLTSAVLLSPYLYIYHVEKKEDGYYHCLVSFGQLVDTIATMRIYNTVIFVFLYFIPLVVIGAFYTIICRKLWLRKIPGNPSNSNRRRADMYKRRAIKMLIIIVIVFASCWLPAHLMHYYVFYEHDTYVRFPPYVSLVAFWISHANSAINPFLYILLNRNFMHAFRDITEGVTDCRGTTRRRRPKSITMSLTNVSNITRDNPMTFLKPEVFDGRSGLYELATVVKLNNKDNFIKPVCLLRVSKSTTM